MKLIEECLKTVYPNPECALEYGNDPWKLLVMGRLSAQCTDARVNIVCKELFAKFPNCYAMAEGNIEDIEKIVRPCGLYKTKADSIKRASEIIAARGGELPSDIDSLCELPGVGRKIANLIVGDIFGGDAVVCDTHCMRICGRLGMYPETLRDPNKIEIILRELISPSEGSDFCHRIVTFGREYCSARSPLCESCPLSHLCDKNIKAKAKTESPRHG